MKYMTDTKDIFLADSNILIYAYEKTPSPEQKKAEDLIARCWASKIRLAVSIQNLAEFAYVAVKKSKLSFDESRVFVEDIANFNGFAKISYSPLTVISAIEISKKYKMSFWDSLISATMIENRIFNIYTENTRDFKVPGINAVNPLK